MGGEVCKKIIAWDIAPEKEYFDELFRVSRNQIIWGGQLLCVAANEMLLDMAKTDHFRKLLNGNVRIRMDIIHGKRKNV